MRGAIPSLPNTPSWRGAQLKHRDNFTFWNFVNVLPNCIRESQTYMFLEVVDEVHNYSV